MTCMSASAANNPGSRYRVPEAYTPAAVVETRALTMMVSLQFTATSAAWPTARGAVKRQ